MNKIDRIYCIPPNYTFPESVNLPSVAKQIKVNAEIWIPRLISKGILRVTYEVVLIFSKGKGKAITRKKNSQSTYREGVAVFRFTNKWKTFERTFYEDAFEILKTCAWSDFVFTDNVPPEALPSELAAFLNIPLETTDTKLEMAMDMRTGMCKGRPKCSDWVVWQLSRCRDLQNIYDHVE